LQRAFDKSSVTENKHCVVGVGMGGLPGFLASRPVVKIEILITVTEEERDGVQYPAALQGL
jgi:hypothetical protein